MRKLYLGIAVLSMWLPLCMLAQDKPAGSLRAKYAARPRDEQRQFLKGLTADQMNQFIHDTVAAIAKDKKEEELRENWEQLTVSTGDGFEQWGEKLLAESRRLTRDRILELLRDQKEDFAWRVAFHGYLRVILKNTEPRDAFEIGLTKDEVAKLKEEIPKMQISTPNQASESAWFPASKK